MEAIKRYMTLGVLVLVVFGCGPSGNKPNVELIQDMMEDPSLKPQEADPNSRDGSAMRLPPEGTVPRGFTPYAFKGNPEGAAQKLRNPYRGDLSPEVVSRGEKHYATYCLVCHGGQGQGDGPVASKMAFRPPSLVGDKVKSMQDGLIYHIMTDGQGVMGSYASQVSPKDRWAIVNYVRSLQKVRTH